MKTSEALRIINDASTASNMDRPSYAQLFEAALALAAAATPAPLREARAALGELVELEAAESRFAPGDDGRHAFESGYLHSFIAGEMTADQLATVKARSAHLRSKLSTEH